MTTRASHVNVLIIGAGLSGIGAAAHLARELPGKSYAILERRADLGGTWDLFRYPGVRSDSDMHRLGYRFRPWTSDRVLADGASIKQYVRDTAAEYGILDKIRYGHRVLNADFSTETNLWTVRYEAEGQESTITADFVWACAGYYSYDEGYLPAFPGIEKFKGRTVHPQFWPEDLDYAGKKVVVIGSGATAITLVPSMAPDAEHVTMLQRSPTYIMSIPSVDPTGSLFRRIMPARAAAEQARWRNVVMQAFLYQLSRRRPDTVRALIRKLTARQLPEGYPVDVDFKPKYDPWDQRLCVVPDGDLFRAIRKGAASIATGEIDTFTKTGIRLKDGTELEADVVVTATGLNLSLMGGLEASVDGAPHKMPEHFVYKGAMIDGLPNFVFVVGYTNASWTLKADLVSEYTIRLLKTMDKKNAKRVVPVVPDGTTGVPLMPLSSGYVTRKADELPMAGERRPWQMPNNYATDIPALRYGKIEDGVLAFE
ncbi:MAG TPA: NAD(P)/FAD-dependent oxidoreductase [Marmoricola sp.]|nr:NAD(P)/FAD-dependent oxidoreductase [Marmoricola sp.]